MAEVCTSTAPPFALHADPLCSALRLGQPLESQTDLDKLLATAMITFSRWTKALPITTVEQHVFVHRDREVALKYF
jgi:hypothetical protein